MAAAASHPLHSLPGTIFGGFGWLAFALISAVWLLAMADTVGLAHAHGWLV